MLVQDIMQTKVATATPDTSLTKVLRLLQGRGFRHVPVVDGGKLVGIISDRDVKQSIASAAMSAEGRERDRLLERLTAGQIMTRPVRTIGPMFTVEDALKLMVTHRISAVPVTEGEGLVGLVTETDVLHLFARAMGVLEPSSRLDVLVREGDTGLGDVVRIVEASGARISSVITLGTVGGGREIVLRLATIDPGPATKALEAGGFTVRDGVRQLPSLTTPCPATS
jgi:acetoin utilization protein AcuB